MFGGQTNAGRHIGRPVALGLLGGLLAAQLVKAVSWLADWPRVWDLLTKADHAIYLSAAERIRSGGPVYQGWQLAGPYGIEAAPELYPPTTVFGLIVPMSYLPDVLWWAIPLTIIAGFVITQRPSMWGWVAILACLAFPRSWIAIASGGLSLWVTAAVALGLRFGWPAIAVLVKPSLAPFALIGIRSRWWWVAALVGLAVSVAMLPLWLDYLTVMRNFHDARGLLYSLDDVPLVLVPIVSRLGGWSVGRLSASSTYRRSRGLVGSVSWR